MLFSNDICEKAALDNGEHDKSAPPHSTAHDASAD